MKQSIDFNDFHQAFNQVRPDNFTFEGLKVLYSSLIDLEDDTGEEFELDVIALCCDFTEGNYFDIADNYNIEISDDNTEEENLLIVLEHLRENTYVCGDFSDGEIVYQQF